MSDTNLRYFEFGEFRLDAHRRILSKNGEQQHVAPRAFDLLYALVANPGRTLGHDELLDMVWSGTFVEQGNLKKTVSSLRQALGESAETGEFITTVPRRGYRFTTSVRSYGDEAVLVRETRSEIFLEEEIGDDPALLPSSRRSDNAIRWWPYLAAVILLAAAASAIFYYRQRPVQRFSASSVQSTRILSGGEIGQGVSSDDGELFLYTLFEGDRRSLWVKQASSGGATQVVEPSTASYWYPTFTPDGHFIYFYRADREDPARSGIYRVPSIGGVPQYITDKNYSGMRFSPDGRRLAVFRTFVEGGTERQDILTIGPDGGDERTILSLPDSATVRGLVWSPDGTSLIYGVKLQTPFEKPLSYIASSPAGGGDQKIILPETEQLFFVDDWLPDGQSLILRLREPNSEIYQIWQYYLSSGEMSRVTNDNDTYTSAKASRDGKSIGAFRTFGICSIWASKDESSEPVQVGSSSEYYSIAWTGDNRLVFSTTESGKEFVGIMNADGSGRRLLTPGTDGIRPFPSVSGDGKIVTFMSDRSGGRQVWSIDLDGRNPSQLTNAVNPYEAKLLADEKTLLYTAYTMPGAWCLIRQNPDGNTSTIYAGDTHLWDVSPDERSVAFFAADSQLKKDRLFVADLATGEITKTFDVADIDGLKWTRDGTGLAFLRYRKDVCELALLPLNGSPEKVITSVKSEGIRNFSWAPDGRRIALVHLKVQNEAVSIRNTGSK